MYTYIHYRRHMLAEALSLFEYQKKDGHARCEATHRTYIYTRAARIYTYIVVCHAVTRRI